MVIVRAVVDPLVPDRMVITLNRHLINPHGDGESETTTSIPVACLLLDRWLSDFHRWDEDTVGREDSR